MSSTSERIYAPPSANLDALDPSTEGVTAAMLASLQGMRGWVRLVSILLLLMGVFIGVGSIPVFIGMLGPVASGITIAVGTVYLVISACYLAVGIYLFRSASAAARALADRSADEFATALSHQRKFWRLCGVFSVLGLLFGIVSLMPFYQNLVGALVPGP